MRGSFKPRLTLQINATCEHSVFRGILNFGIYPRNREEEILVMGLASILGQFSLA